MEQLAKKLGCTSGAICQLEKNAYKLSKKSKIYEKMNYFFLSMGETLNLKDLYPDEALCNIPKIGNLIKINPEKFTIKSVQYQFSEELDTLEIKIIADRRVSNIT